MSGVVEWCLTVPCHLQLALLFVCCRLLWLKEFARRRIKAVTASGRHKWWHWQRDNTSTLSRLRPLMSRQNKNEEEQVDDDDDNDDKNDNDQFDMILSVYIWREWEIFEGWNQNRRQRHFFCVGWVEVSDLFDLWPFQGSANHWPSCWPLHRSVSLDNYYAHQRSQKVFTYLFVRYQWLLFIIYIW